LVVILFTFDLFFLILVSSVHFVFTMKTMWIVGEVSELKDVC